MNSASNDNGPPKAHPDCPICTQKTAAEYAPFCSKRCADVDLHRWLSGGYAIAASDDDSEGAADNDGQSRFDH
ncbi:MAG: DNA gyrase inhibitor YacG [Pseudomonadota bacterium]